MSRTGIIGDVHGNLPALEAVISAAECDSWLCVGDIVGYGPQPNECTGRVMELGALAVVGNHDLGSIDMLSLAPFNQDARRACEWTRRVLDRRARDFLGSLPGKLSDKDTLLVHASPRDPAWEYVLTETQAYENLLEFEEHLCFNGHSHVPEVFSIGIDGEPDLDDVQSLTPDNGESVEIESCRRYMANVGSIGQPRDGDPRACYVVLDSDRGLLSYHRVPYEVSRTQLAMEEAGLPSFLIRRLSVGR